ncbi:PLAC8 family protein [Actinidia rufa]|uniref:PLAC8 family protein n=1 Tax=Actinidia rufa TaxID=165716 RepID=A0A7J0GPQ1_9ERIC|nr:PLAC8 family protein [Actinidia rufa]
MEKIGGKRGTGDEIHVRGDDALVVASVVVLAGLGGEAGAVAAVVDEEEVSIVGGSEEIGEGFADVVAGGLGVRVVCVDEHRDVFLAEAVALHLGNCTSFSRRLRIPSAPPWSLGEVSVIMGKLQRCRVKTAAAWEHIGEIANMAQLIGLDTVRLIGLIVKAASTARMHKKNCRQFAQHLKLIGNLLEQLKISKLKRYPETREPLEQLEDALRRSYILVNSCQDRSYLYLLAMGWNIVYQFRRAQREID